MRWNQKYRTQRHFVKQPKAFLDCALVSRRAIALLGISNQFAHQSLQRGQAKKYLDALLANWV
jgi:hypothetical protein